MPMVPSVHARSVPAGGVAVERGVPDRLAVERFLAGDFWVAAGSLAGGVSLLCGATLALRRCMGSIAALPGPIGLLAVCTAGILLVAISDVVARAAGRGGMSGGRFGTIATRVGLVTALHCCVDSSSAPS
ncbi:MAG: hypothetical protein EBZ59_04625 [Planctomycetia bacterium]|nr:hypothetical protein [Planctomycetia bacterium]